MMMLRDDIKNIIRQIANSDVSLPTRKLVWQIEEYDEIANLLSNMIASRNARSLAHPIDDMREVFFDPDSEYEKYDYESIEDERLSSFIKPIVVAIIALMGLYYSDSDSYEDMISHVLNLDVLNYLSAHGRSLATYGYDDAYDAISRLCN